MVTTDRPVKFEFRIVNKEIAKALIESKIVELNSRKEFDQKLRDLRKENYVLEFEVVK